MSVKFYPNGPGGTVGDRLDTCHPLLTSGNIWYLSSLIGTDAASPAGQNREKPLATIAQAMTNATDDDIIVCLQGHTETLTAVQSVSKRVAIVGEGTTSGKPGVSFLMNNAASTIFGTAVAGAEFRNLYFPENVQTNTSAKLAITVDNVRVVGCYFEQGAKDTGAGISLATCNQVRFETTTVISTAPTRAAQPLAAIKATAAAAIARLSMEDVMVSAGAVGYSNYSAVDLSAAATVTQLNVLGMSLLVGSDMDLPAGWTGRINVQLATGGSRVNAP